MKFQYDLQSSSSVEKLEQEHVVRWQLTGNEFETVRVEEERYHICFYPNRHIIDIANTTVVLDSSISSMGNNPRYLASENILVFADEVQRVKFLEKMLYEQALKSWEGSFEEWVEQDKYSEFKPAWDEWIAKNLLPIEINDDEAEIIPFPITTPTLPPREHYGQAKRYHEVATKSNLGPLHPGRQNNVKTLCRGFLFEN